MEKKNGFFTFITALVPGVGYMYLGLRKQGAQTLALFILLSHILPHNIILFPFWFYTFFDTYNIAKKISQGEQISDCKFFFEKHSSNFSNIIENLSDRNLLKKLAWLLIVIGILSIINEILDSNYSYYLFMRYLNSYFVPVLFIAGGIYLLIKEKKA